MVDFDDKGMGWSKVKILLIKRVIKKAPNLFSNDKSIFKVDTILDRLIKTFNNKLLKLKESMY